ncbi:hypothetical protein [Paenibacillus sanfengchensis]|uniref:DMP19 family protein n=1 Tax=Paenibacillus sanfengchensis TaxID=3119819 RepID=UPI002FE03FAA
MRNIRDIVMELLPASTDLESFSPQTWIEHLALEIYKPAYGRLREQEILLGLPAIIQDIIVLFDLDTELAINGILGYLGNSSGRYLNETIEVLRKIGALEDSMILKQIRKVLFSEIRGLEDMDDEAAEQIQRLADGLYLYSADRDVFRDLVEYLEMNRHTLLMDLNAWIGEEPKDSGAVE